ncbi:GNAT family N-acetyltransferase [Streptococcus hillyeri]|uniref:GNAT family N-acetyltransferase n=1 Tax=Streptococcus hillyeri TaxID=2282420 RepID=A0A3L9DRQ7_9STRE|nr:GNAT family N-acetyltransferase [Streptococcus hillyeri]RLY04136.1 GNAT family N-acetyltransferase [Streptococcus hillyeri]
MEVRKISLEDKNAFQRFEEAMLRDKQINPFVEWWETANFENYVADSDVSEVKKEGQSWSTFTRYFAFEDEQILGMLICFWEIQHPDCQKLGHLGYMVAPAFRKQGVAFELVQYGLERYREKGISNIYIAMDEKNVASRKTAEKAGGILLGTFDINHQGQKIQSVNYEVHL